MSTTVRRTSGVTNTVRDRASFMRRGVPEPCVVPVFGLPALLTSSSAKQLCHFTGMWVAQRRTMRLSITILVGVLAACGGETQQAQGPGAGGADSKPDAAATGGEGGADAAAEGATNPCAGKACGEGCHSWRVNAEACDISGQCSEANYAMCSCGGCTPACQAMGACNTGSSGGGAGQAGAGGAGGGTGGPSGTGGRNPCEFPPPPLRCFTAEPL